MNKTSKHQDKSFGYRFAMLHRLQMAICRKDILVQGLQPSLLPFIISLVREEAPVTQEHLSNHLAIDKGTTARALSQLEKKGYVHREINPKNRRENKVRATPKAHAAADRLFISLTRVSDIFVEGFTNQEKESIRILMDRMLFNARKAANHI